MEYFGLIGICVIALFPLALLKKKASEQGILLVLAVVLLVVFRSISLAAPWIKAVENLFGQAGIERAYLGILLRTVAVELVANLCAGLCRDGGSQALAAAVELAGAVASLIIALPLMEAVVQLLMGYIG